MSNTGPLVAVLGGAGYIGSCLVPHLLAEGYRVRLFDNFHFGKDGVRDLDSPSLKIIEGDICDTKAVSSVIRGVDVVILLAAIVGGRVRDARWTSPRDINFLATTVALNAAIEHGAERFIFASSDSVYGVQPGIKFETSLPQPVSLYARLKLRMEERIINSKNRSFHPTALRIATCHGYSPRMRFDLVANSLILDAVCKKELTILLSGEQYRSMIHVDDAARSFISCLKAHENLISGEIFNVGAPDQNLQVNQLANIVQGLVPEAIITIKGGEPDVVDYHLSSAKIEKVLDFKAHWSLQNSISQLRDMLIENRFEDPYSLKYHNF